MRSFFGGLYEIPLMSLLCRCDLKVQIEYGGYRMDFLVAVFVSALFCMQDAALAGRDGVGLFLCFYFLRGIRSASWWVGMRV